MDAVSLLALSQNITEGAELSHQVLFLIELNSLVCDSRAIGSPEDNGRENTASDDRTTSVRHESLQKSLGFKNLYTDQDGFCSQGNVSSLKDYCFHGVSELCFT